MEFVIDRRQKQNRDRESVIRVPELCRQRLLGYAESFRELSRDFCGEFVWDNLDRQSILEERRLWENRQAPIPSLAIFVWVAPFRDSQKYFVSKPIQSNKNHIFPP